MRTPTTKPLVRIQRCHKKREAEEQHRRADEPDTPMQEPKEEHRQGCERRAMLNRDGDVEGDAGFLESSDQVTNGGGMRFDAHALLLAFGAKLDIASRTGVAHREGVVATWASQRETLTSWRRERNPSSQAEQCSTIGVMGRLEAFLVAAHDIGVQLAGDSAPRCSEVFFGANVTEHDCTRTIGS